MKMHNDVFGEKDDIIRIINRVYDRAYDKGYRDRQIEEEFDEDREKAIKEAYQKGLDDAWKCAKKISLHCNDGGYSHKELRDIFAESSWEDVIKHMSVSEAIAKVKEYEEKQKADKEKADDEIKVGDEVMVDERRMIVLGIDSAEWRQLWCPSTGFVHSNITTLEMTKTGRHFDIQNLLDQIKDEQ